MRHNNVRSPQTRTRFAAEQEVEDSDVVRGLYVSKHCALKVGGVNCS